MVHYERVLVVGVGLLGGSLGLALRQRALATHVVGFGRNPEQLRLALELGAITELSTDLKQACSEADVVVVCTPVQQIVSLVQEACRWLPARGWVTDVGSTKGTICRALDTAAERRFCGAHPLAGSDKSGVAFADPHLFVGRLTILTPSAETSDGLLGEVAAFWQGVESRTICMSAEEHDAAVARTSHLPHVAAAALAGITPDALLPLAAAGWCDTTRVAAGHVEMWRQIMCENRPSLVAAVRDYATALEGWIEALEQCDDDRLLHLLQTGKQQRDSVGN